MYIVVIRMFLTVERKKITSCHEVLLDNEFKSPSPMIIKVNNKDNRIIPSSEGIYPQQKKNLVIK